MTRLELTDDERDLILAGLFELTITHVDDDEKREPCKVLALKVGGNPDETFFEATQTRLHPPLRERGCSRDS